MCKILVIPEVKAETVKDAWKFIEKITPKLSSYNNDGLGYAAFDSQFELFAEKWLKNWQAYNRGMWSDEDIYLVDILGYDNVKEEPQYESYGTIKRDDIRSIVLHARKATCGVSLENVHPFIKHDTALIHNGMVYNHADLKKEMSTCDSETILQEYIDYNVSEDPEQIHGVIESIKAYFACAVLTKDDKGNPVLDIFKSPGADLHCTYVSELKTIVFSTAKTDLEETIKDLGWKVNTIFEFNDDVYIRFDLLTGKKVATFAIDSDETYVKPVATKKEEKHAQVVQGQTEKEYGPSDDDADDPELAALIERYADDVDWKQLIDDEFDERTVLQRSQIT